MGRLNVPEFKDAAGAGSEVGGRAELPVVDVHVGATYSKSFISLYKEVFANKD